MAAGAAWAAPLAWCGLGLLRRALQVLAVGVGRTALLVQTLRCPMLLLALPLRTGLFVLLVVDLWQAVRSRESECAV
jgi:hypothetical protein